MKLYTIENRPQFTDGQPVEVDMTCFGFPKSTFNGNPTIFTGRVVGKAVSNIIDQWLIEFATAFPPTYPYHVVSVPHTFIVDRY
jgi:hypothetical protein